MQIPESCPYYCLAFIQATTAATRRPGHRSKKWDPPALRRDTGRRAVGSDGAGVGGAVRRPPSGSAERAPTAFRPDRPKARIP